VSILKVTSKESNIGLSRMMKQMESSSAKWVDFKSRYFRILFSNRLPSTCLVLIQFICNTSFQNLTEYATYRNKFSDLD